MLHEVRLEYTHGCGATSRHTNNPKNEGKMVHKSYKYFTVSTLKDSKVYENFHKQDSHAK